MTARPFLKSKRALQMSEMRTETPSAACQQTTPLWSSALLDKLQRMGDGMTQAERMRSASNNWEADPWDASDKVADAQLAGFCERARKVIVWTPVLNASESLFGLERQKLVGADVAYFATHDGENMLLMQLVWHGFPDPPEWRLATRQSEIDDPWKSWGYFAAIPRSWQLPDKGS